METQSVDQEVKIVRNPGKFLRKQIMKTLVSETTPRKYQTKNLKEQRRKRESITKKKTEESSSCDLPWTIKGGGIDNQKLNQGRRKRS